MCRPYQRPTVGVIQIYYTERDRTFTPMEIKMANLMAKRLSFVVARKKILSMHRNNEKKEAIISHIFRTLGTRGGVKMKEIFDRVIPELADMVNLQSCAFFSVSEDLWARKSRVGPCAGESRARPHPRRSRRAAGAGPT